jgi:hypothetical protein
MKIKRQVIVVSEKGLFPPITDVHRNCWFLLKSQWVVDHNGMLVYVKGWLSDK